MGEGNAVTNDEQCLVLWSDTGERNAVTSDEQGLVPV
jgi:hypothetical protein